jgi:phosphoglycolate phosphatase
MNTYIFFDLDGTIIQSEFGIIEAAEYALGKMGIEVKDKASMKRMIGPPLYVSFRDLWGMDDEKAQEAVRLYREYYGSIGMYKSPMYKGVEQVLKELRDKGAVLAVVTGKPTDLSESILEHLHIRDMFEAVVGPSRSSKDPRKADLIRQAIDILGITKDEYRNTIMVGDRCFDIEGAKEVGIASVGVTFGYGSREELENAGADLIISEAEELIGVVTNIAAVINIHEK